VSNLKSEVLVRSPIFVLIVLLTSLILVVLAGSYFVHAQSYSPSTNYTSQSLGVKITAPKSNEVVPTGQLIVNGTSSDTSETNCQVYIDWNDAKPMQNVTGQGPGGPDDFSSWTFTYTQNYHLIVEGANELTSKISCNGDNGISGMTKYYSINVTGSTGPNSPNITTTSGNTPNFDNFTTVFHGTGSSPILPQYLNTVANDSQSTNDDTAKETGKSATYAAINSKYDKDANNYEALSSQYSAVTSQGNDYSSNANTKTDSGIENNKKLTDNKEDGNIKSFSMKNFMSLNVDKTGYKPFKFKFKWYNGNDNGDFNSEELSKYIHNRIKERLDRISERLLD
jgi:hypothetical protein